MVTYLELRPLELAVRGNRVGSSGTAPTNDIASVAVQCHPPHRHRVGLP